LQEKETALNDIYLHVTFHVPSTVLKDQHHSNLKYVAEMQEKRWNSEFMALKNNKTLSCKTSSRKHDSLH
jgi:hypothetical protein